MPFVGIIWIWTFARIIESALKEEHHKKLLAISQNTYGVYLWAEPLNYLVLSCVMKWFGISVFGTEMGAALIYIVRVVGTVVISVLITNVLPTVGFFSETNLYAVSNRKYLGSLKCSINAWCCSW